MVLLGIKNKGPIQHATRQRMLTAIGNSVWVSADCPNRLLQEICRRENGVWDTAYLGLEGLSSICGRSFFCCWRYFAAAFAS